ncbi:hypothetical protein CIB48_g7298 [Xylaria polymorpha]|nr:hypothetical protein CIB48_g7298 [Xylaria polymorpha]
MTNNAIAYDGTLGSSPGRDTRPRGVTCRDVRSVCSRRPTNAQHEAASTKSDEHREYGCAGDWQEYYVDAFRKLAPPVRRGDLNGVSDGYLLRLRWWTSNSGDALFQRFDIFTIKTWKKPVKLIIRPMVRLSKDSN